MDEMTLWEINDIIECIPYLDKNLWESQRLGAYVMAQVHTKEELKFTDICNFPWEDVKKENTKKIKTRDIERLKAKAEKVKQSLQIESIMKKE